MKSDLEPPLRFSIGYANTALEYLGRLPEDEELGKAIRAFDKAIKHIRRYGADNDIEIRESMPT